MACGKCGSTRIGVKRNRLKALLPSLPSLSFNKKDSGFKRNSNPLKKMIKPAIVLILAGFGTPLLLEGTLNGCHSLEKKVINLLSTTNSLAQYAGYGMMVAQYSGGKFAETAIYYSGSSIPPIVACPVLYWKYTAMPQSLKEDARQALSKFGMPINF